MHPLKTLVEEHKLVMKMLDALRALAVTVDRAGKIAPEKFDYAVKFLREFLDTYHWGKEERVFFAMLQARGISRRDRIVDVLLADHRQGREYISAIAAGLENYKNGQVRGITEAAEQIHKLGGLISKHVAKENTSLLPVAVKMLSDADYSAMSVKFENIAKETIGIDAVTRYEGIIEKIT